MSGELEDIGDSKIPDPPENVAGSPGRHTLGSESSRPDVLYLVDEEEVPEYRDARSGRPEGQT